MPTYLRHDSSHASAAGETQVAPAGRHHTPMPLEFSFLRPPLAEGEIGRLGGYRILKLLGSGGMGKVFLAEDLALKRAVALKVMCLPPGEDILSWRERFLREARAQAGTRHPNLVTVFQVGEDRGTVFLAMELLEGETLEARIRRSAPLPIPEAVRIAEDVLRGLAAIHAHGLIHRDIKPANIWLAAGTAPVAPTDETDPLCFHDPAPRVEAPAAPPAKILDFGLVREVRADTHLTEAGAVVGTPMYMSPEQARGRPLDHRTDLFSFGCVLYAMCTGRPPFMADTPMAQAAALAADDPIPARKLNADVPRALSGLIDGLLAKEPDERPTGADEVLDRLRTLDTADEHAAPRPTPRAPKGNPYRAWYAVAGVVAIGLVAAVAAAVSLTRSAAPSGDRDKVEKAEKAAPPKPAPKPAKPPEPAADYLADMNTIRAVPFPPPGRPAPPGLDGPLSVGGAKAPRAILMHPAPQGEPMPTQRVYQLNGAYAKFEANVGFNDSADRTASPVGFVVVADGRPVWQSRPMIVGQPVEHVDVDVRGVSTLILSTVLLGPEHRGAHAVWLDPRLTK